MKTFKNDKRSLRTRTQIKLAVASLLDKKSPDEINISEITRLADVSRNSFYTHYSTVSDVLLDLYYDVISKISDIMRNHTYEDFISNPYPLLKDFTKPFFEDRLFTEYIVFSKNANMFVQGFIDALTEQFTEIYYKERGNTNPAMPYLINFLVSGIIGFIYKWFRDNKPVPFEDVLNQASLLIKASIISIRDIKKEI
ncbi:MAG: TetR/AcrR family transcriptional regulator [Clostridia bacterium]|nr:TetR/AcrR family transcriptional regulator [Clostridia bacterium]